LGQWWAHQLDLDWVYPPDHVRSALRSVFRYNFRGHFHGIRQAPRKFVADDDAGLQMITWPKGDRPRKHTRYADEVMTGFEYAAAAAMIQAGLLREGLTVIRAIAIRYDGRKREDLTATAYSSWGYSGNPFGDDECGKFYARAMSVWSVLLACQGFIYDGPAGRIGFRPKWKPEDHRSFFTTAQGWGLFTQCRDGRTQHETIEIRYGKLAIQKLEFEIPEGRRADRVLVRRGSEDISTRYTTKEQMVRIRLTEQITLTPDEPPLLITIRLAR